MSDVRQATGEELLREKADVLFIDVRQPEEYRAAHIPGALLIPLGELEQRLAEVPRDRDVVVVCRSGGRSTRACGLLSGHGYERIRNLQGGMLAWRGATE